eukprot:TRINITY_DN10719_c0_g1_i1.p1 TRINITY_DN10719_c0_g1~~TRINITY_DN10719_c0_g1_i1.p1  ORF type:complete len:261 (+),score=51.80 TRINITY_DN10719_c0_g1_i1:169-951(+)
MKMIKKSKTKKNEKPKLHFGVPLESSFKISSEGGGGLHITLRCLSWIELHGLEVEGVFRVPGDGEKIQLWREMIENGDDLDFGEDAVVHDVCGFFKMYLREIPEGLLPEKYTSHFNLTDPDPEFMKNIVSMLKELPQTNSVILIKLIGLLHKISERSEINKMNVNNLSTCLAQVIWNEKKNEQPESNTSTPKSDRKKDKDKDKDKESESTPPPVDKFSLATTGTDILKDAAIANRVLNLMIRFYVPLRKHTVSVKWGLTT